MVMNPESTQPSEYKVQLTQDCQQFDIPFTDLSGIDWTNVSGIGWVVGATTPEYTFQIDNVELK